MRYARPFRPRHAKYHGRLHKRAWVSERIPSVRGRLRQSVLQGPLMTHIRRGLETTAQPD